MSNYDFAWCTLFLTHFCSILPFTISNTASLSILAGDSPFSFAVIVCNSLFPSHYLHSPPFHSIYTSACWIIPNSCSPTCSSLSLLKYSHAVSLINITHTVILPSKSQQSSPQCQFSSAPLHKGHKVNALKDEKEELQSLKEGEGDERWKRPYEIVLSFSIPTLYILCFLKGKTSWFESCCFDTVTLKALLYTEKSSCSHFTIKEKRLKGGTPWLHGHFFQLRCQLQELQMTATVTWYGPWGCWCKGLHRCMMCPATQEGRKKAYFYPDPCTDSPNGPNSSAGITGRGKKRGRAHEAVTHCFLFDQRGGLVAEGDNRICLANTTAERKLCLRDYKQVFFSKTQLSQWKKSYCPHFLLASPRQILMILTPAGTVTPMDIPQSCLD